MRPALALIALTCLGGCNKAGPCAPNGLLVDLTLDDDVAAADALDITLTVPGQPTRLGQKSYKMSPGRTSGGLRVDFADGVAYPAGQSATVTVTAYQGAHRLGFGSTDAGKLSAGCTEVAVHVTRAGEGGCSRDGWCWTNPLPTGNVLFSVWSGSDGDVWASGSAGTLLRRHGGAWSAVDTGLDVDLDGITGSAPNDVWACGGQGTLLHWTGDGQWSQTSIGSGVDLHRARAAADGTLWVAGDEESIFERKGGAWTEVHHTAGGHRLLGVWAANENEVWAVGEGSLVLHGVNGAYTPVTIPVALELRDVWSDGAGKFWLVGFDGSTGSGHVPTPILTSSDGKTWTTVATSETNEYDALWGTGSDDVWAVGNAAARHWHNQQWKLAGVDRTLNGVSGGPGGVWGVGVAGNIVRLQAGDMDNVTATPERGGVTPYYYFGVWAYAPNQVWAAASDRVAVRWDGRSWQPLSMDPPPGNVVRVWGRSPEDLWFVGGQDGSNHGSISHWDGRAWQAMPGTLGQANYAIGGTSDDAWIVGTGVSILRYDGKGTWNAVPHDDVDNTISLNGVWESPDRVAYAVGDQGLILTWSQAAGSDKWTTSRRATPGTVLYGVSGVRNGDGSLDVWAVGAGNDVVHLDTSGGNTVWDSSARIMPASYQHWYAVWERAKNDVWIAGSGGAMEHWDGTRWSPVASGTQSDLRNISGVGYDVWAVGDNGTIMHLHQRDSP